MQTPLTDAAGLYHLVLGAAWDELDESVRRFHAEGVVTEATGTFRVAHGNAAARLLAWLAGLPPAAESVDMRLLVTPTAHAEEWRRSFAGWPLVSTQWRVADGVLAERMGLVQFHFRLEAMAGALLYHTKRVVFRLGPIGIPLLSWFAPRVTASEKPAGTVDKIHTRVEVRLPIIGLLVSYEGVVTRVGGGTKLPIAIDGIRG